MYPRTFILDPGFDNPSGHHCVSNAALVRLLPPPVYLFGTADSGEAAGVPDAMYHKGFPCSIYAAHYHWKKSKEISQVLSSPISYIRRTTRDRRGTYFNDIKAIFDEFGINRSDTVIAHTESSLLTRSLLNVFHRRPEKTRPQLLIRLLLPGHPVSEDDPRPYQALAALARRSNYVKTYAELRAAKDALTNRFGLPVIDLVRLALPLSDTPPDRKERVRLAGRLTITFPGEFRDEKGWQQIAPIIDSLRRMKPKLVPRLLVHGTNAKASYFRDPEDHIGRLRCAGAELQLGPLSNDEFGRLLSETDVLLLPYDVEAYRLRGSGIALDGVVHGSPMVVTAGSALTELIEDGNGIAASGIDGLAKALKRVSDNYDHYADRAIVARDRARKWLGGNAMVDAVEEHANLTW